MIAQPTPLNNVTLTNNHGQDVYTSARNSVNGATYIRWDSSFYHQRGGRDVLGPRSTTTHPAAISTITYPPLNIPESVKQALQDIGKNVVMPSLGGDPRLGGLIDTSGIMEKLTNPVVSPLDGAITYFDYSSLLKSLKAGSGGSFDVTLGGSTGTNVSGNLLTGLASNKSASLSFKQEGVTITFAGADMKMSSAPQNEMYNVEFSNKAPDSNAMLSAAGSGGSSFTYSFDYHGNLPGTATFAVETNIAEGTKVNVYRFDTATGGFTTIAAGVKVGAGGVVTYKNNTMSEYIITTNTIKGAKTSDMAAQNGGAVPWVWIAAALAAVVIVAAAIVLLLRRNRRTVVKK